LGTLGELAFANGGRRCRGEDAERLRKIFSSVRQAFNKAFVKPDGTVGEGSQTS